MNTGYENNMEVPELKQKSITQSGTNKNDTFENKCRIS